ncbi:tRNA uracil 4-sulfurtransferase ThiI [Streptomyces albidoflavus]
MNAVVPAQGVPDLAGPVPIGPCVLLKHGEVFLKGRNRHLFVERLHDNLRGALRGVTGSIWIKEMQNVTVLGGDAPQDELIARARRVMGFVAVQPAMRVETGEKAIVAAAVAALDGAAPGTTFAVRARRRHKPFPLTSTQLERLVGARIQEAHGLPVDLTRPDIRVEVEIDRKESYVSGLRHTGQGGLPVGTSGRALVLLSGGYDSPVAAHRAMRRGLRCDFVHFTGAPYTNAASAFKAYALARELNRYQPPGKLHIVALGHAQKQLAVAGAGRFQVVGQRRLMVKAASVLARRLRAQALVTGDALGQVASQTLSNMALVDEAATLPVLRPLIGWEKQEIIDEARRVGTAEISVLPDEDCCQLLAPRQVSLRTKLEDVAGFEKRLDADELIDQMLASAQVTRPGTDETPAPATPPAAPACGTD